jgi:hypothetical protein
MGWALRRSAAEDGGGAAILLRDAKPVVAQHDSNFKSFPGRRKIAAPPPLRAAAAHGTERPLGRPPAWSPGGKAYVVSGGGNDAGVGGPLSANPQRYISAERHEAFCILRRQLHPQTCPQFLDAQHAHIIVEIAQTG